MPEPSSARPKVYLETTVVSYLTSRPSRDVIVRAHQKLTQQWWRLWRADYQVFVSELVQQESSRGDTAAAAARARILSQLASLPMRPAIPALAEHIAALIHLPARAKADSFHLAFAISYRLDYLLTWNCAHLANAGNLRILKEYSLREAIWLPVICTPEEFADETR